MRASNAPSQAGAALVLGFILLVGIVRLPAQLTTLVDQWPIISRWQQPDVQYRLLLDGVPYDTLRAAETLLPRTAPLLLVTAGSDVRHSEYITYHRALYFLAPRSIWWLSPAPSDGTWESRWWISAPVTAGSIERLAADKGLACVLFVGMTVPALPGQMVAEWDAGVLWQVGGEQGACRAASTQAVPEYPTDAWPLRLLVALLLVLALGYGVLGLARQLGYRASGPTAVAQAWLVGSGLLPVGMFWLNSLGAGLNSQMLLLTPLALAAAGFYLWSRRRGPAPGEEEGSPLLPAPSLVMFVLLAFVALQAGYVLLLSSGRPFTVWDSWVNWGMKARTIFIEGAITDAVVADPTRAVTLLDYPLSVPLLQAWIYGWLGAPDDRLAGGLFLLFYLALLGLVYSAVGRWSRSPAFALLAVAALAATGQVTGLAAIAYPDLLVAALAVLAAVSLQAWLNGAATGQLLVGAVAAGLLPWTKREGLILLAALCLALLLLGGWRSRRGWLAVLAAAVAAALLAGPWWWQAAGNEAAVEVFLPLNPANLWLNSGRLPNIAGRMLLSLLAAPTNYVWPLALLLASAGWWRGRRPEPQSLFLPLAAILYLGMMSVPYFVSDFVPYQQHIVSSAPRLVAQVTPLVLLWIAYSGSGPRREPL